MKKLLAAIARHNARGKQIKFYAEYGDGKYRQQLFSDCVAEQLQPLYSITKFITCATLLTIAERHNIALNQPLLDYLPAYRPPNRAAEKLTIDQFANMTTGIAWREIDAYRQPNNAFDQFVIAAQPLDFLFSRQIDANYHFNYNSAASHVLVYWSEAVTGKAFEASVAEWLFRPLDIARFSWQRDAQGRVFGGHGLALYPEDFIKLMPLLASGAYNGRPILSKAVLQKLHTICVKGALGYRGYGYGLWHGKIKNAPFIGAFGNAGQRIYYFPTLRRSHAFLGNTKPEFGIQEAILATIL